MKTKHITLIVLLALLFLSIPVIWYVYKKPIQAPPTEAQRVLRENTIPDAFPPGFEAYGKLGIIKNEVTQLSAEETKTEYVFDSSMDLQTLVKEYQKFWKRRGYSYQDPVIDRDVAHMMFQKLDSRVEMLITKLDGGSQRVQVTITRKGTTLHEK